MMLYLYPEEWTGRRAREVHTLSTCVALARAGRPVTLVSAGGEPALRRQLSEMAGTDDLPGLELVFLSRKLGPIRSSGLFSFRFERWLRTRTPFAVGFVIHLKAAQMLRRANVPYAFEAHEIFGETPRGHAELQHALEQMEQEALTGAAFRIATSGALAGALAARYGIANDFHVVPNAGEAPLTASLAQAGGPFVYLGSIADWKGVELLLAAAREAGVPLRIVGGTEAEWKKIAAQQDVRQVQWQPRVPVTEIPQALAGARAGLIATEPASGSGRYSCPMKLFDYARCGLPVLTNDLPSLQSLDAGAWCLRVPEPTVQAWAEMLRQFRFNADLADEALAWSAGHTWNARAEALKRILPSA